MASPATRRPRQHRDAPFRASSPSSIRDSNGGGKDGFDDRDPTKLVATGFLYTCEHDGGDGVDGLPLGAALCLVSGERDDDDDQTAAAWLWRQRRGPSQRQLWPSGASSGSPFLFRSARSLSFGSHSLFAVCEKK
ncbi:uncharacterized protein DS421_15g499790 [Arachis hypogaea]|nr:uncharacterized protein DS421_15g499790 [Arachis hypogaea]